VTFGDQKNNDGGRWEVKGRTLKAGDRNVGFQVLAWVVIW